MRRGNSVRWMIALIAALVGSTAAVTLRAQQRDSTRISIHELESMQHAWDALKLDSRSPALERGKHKALDGDLGGAQKEFQKALKNFPASAYFNLGLVAFQQGQYRRALENFRQSYRMRRDSVCREFMNNTKRLLNEQRKPK